MTSFRKESLPERIAHALRDSIASGTRGRKLPGLRALSQELDVSINTVRQALVILENEGTIAQADAGKRRSIAAVPTQRLPRTGDSHATGSKTVAIFLPLAADSFEQTVATKLAMQLPDKGIRPLLFEANMQNPKDIARVTEQVAVDLCVLVRPAEPVTNWAAKEDISCITFGGEPTDAFAHVGPDQEQILKLALSTLVGLGHRRIVTLIDPAIGENRQTALVFDTLAELGIRPSPFNVLPLTPSSPVALGNALDSACAITPPTAIVAARPDWALFSLTHLTSKGVYIPEKISLISLRDDHLLPWTVPAIAAISVPVDNAIAPILDTILRTLSLSMHYNSNSPLKSLDTRLESRSTLASPRST